jgi:hypothetical protein
MAKEERKKIEDHETLDVGTVITGWETWEFPVVERSTEWYVIAGIIGLAMLLYALLSANFVFALILLMFAVIMLMRDMKKPAKVTVYITTSGIVYGDEFHHYDAIRDFSIIYTPPDVKQLYVTFNNRLQPMLSIPLEDSNPNTVRQSLLPYVMENLRRDGESLTDTLRRVYKL